MHCSMKHMGQTLRKAREDKGLTQAALAEAIEVSNRTVIAIEKGERNPTFEVLLRLLCTLDVPADLIFRPNNTPHTQEQEQFICEYLHATVREQRIAASTARNIWRELRETNHYIE